MAPGNLWLLSTCSASDTALLREPETSSSRQRNVHRPLWNVKLNKFKVLPPNISEYLPPFFFQICHGSYPIEHRVFTFTMSGSIAIGSYAAEKMPCCWKWLPNVINAPLVKLILLWVKILRPTEGEAINQLGMHFWQIKHQMQSPSPCRQNERIFRCLSFGLQKV